MSELLRPPRLVRITAHGAAYAAAAIIVVPFLWMVMTAVKSDAEAIGVDVTLLPAGSPATWRWGNFAEAWRQADLGRMYWNSTLVAVVVTALSVAHNALAGYAFAKLRFRGDRLAFGLTLLTLLLPFQVSFIFAYVACGWLGYVDRLHALIVPFLASAFGIFYMRQSIRSIPDSLLEAGRLDGLSELDIFVHLVAPLSRPALAALAIFTFMASWNNFFWPLIVIDSSDRFTLPLGVAALSSGLYVESWPVQMAAATIIVVPTVAVFLVFQRAFVEGVALTGVKQ